MRILVANKFGYLRGGLERVMLDEMGWLRAAGHDVELFATTDQRNVPARYADEFPSYREIGPGSPFKFESVRRMFWNREAHDAMARVLGRFKPDVLHVHGIHRHLSPSVLEAARDACVPSIMTSHDFHLICPGNVLLRGTGAVCEPRACGRVWFGECVGSACVQGSTMRSALAATELGYQRARGSYALLDTIVCPSQFMANQLRGGGIPVRLEVVRNAVPAVPAVSAVAGAGEQFLVVGRLSAEKGVEMALEAARVAGVQLIVAGDGPLGASLRERFPEATFMGHVPYPDLAVALASVRAVVVPSLSLENAPMSVLEAMASGVSVIASDAGGIPELVVHEENGLLVPPGDIGALAAALLRLQGNPSLARRLGQVGRVRSLAEFAPAAHTAGLLRVYENAIGRTCNP
jgi:glycosyltransferase involved in cell wall biosynthesis